MIKSLLFISFCLALASCKSLKPPVFNGIANVQMNSASLRESQLTLDLNFTNPNHSRARLKNAEGDAWMDSIFLGHFIVDTSINIPSNSDFLIPVKLNVEMKHILQHSLSLFMKDEVNIRIQGKAKVGKAGIYKQYPLDYTGRQKLAKLLQ